MTKEEARQMVQEMNTTIENSKKAFTDWERSFVESITSSKYPNLTEKQEKCLVKIYERITS